MHAYRRTPAHGFTLIEMAIVLVIIGLAAIMIIKASGGMLDNEKRKTVRITLDTVDTALANFVAVHKRLPCPADGALASGAANAGVELLSAGACNPATEVHGVVPWVTLGLSEQAASDPWHGRLSYRVDPALAGNAPLPLLMNMSNCDPAATGPAVAGACVAPALACTGSAACTAPANFLLGKGLDVWDGNNGVPGFNARQNNRITGSGAAYVLIAHGPSGVGAYNANGRLQTGLYNLSEEGPNLNNQAVVLAATPANTYRDRIQNDNITRRPPPASQLVVDYYLYFDDYLSHPTIMSVLNRANLGPRAH